jgi:hypothetical protein
MRVPNPNTDTLPQVKIEADLRICRVLNCDSLGGLKLRKRMIWNNLSAWWWNHVFVKGAYARFVIKNHGIQGVYAP